MPIDIKSLAIGKANGGGGGDITIKPLTVTENGTYSEQGVAYSPVIANFDDTIAFAKYVCGDEPFEVVRDDITAIPTVAFYANQNIVKIDLPNVTVIGGQALKYCENLKEINLPKLKTSNTTYSSATGNQEPIMGTGITKLYLPMFGADSSSTNRNFVGSAFIRMNRKMRYLILPKFNSGGGNSGLFAQNNSLALLILGYRDTGFAIPPYAFERYTTQAIKSFILDSKVFVELAQISAITVDAFTGTIYVPDLTVEGTDNVQRYKSATNWSTYSNQFKGYSEADNYATDKAYTIGDVCKHSGKLYAWINETDGNSEPINDIQTMSNDWYCIAEV